MAMVTLDPPLVLTVEQLREMLSASEAQDWTPSAIFAYDGDTGWVLEGNGAPERINDDGNGVYITPGGDRDYG